MKLGENWINLPVIPELFENILKISQTCFFWNLGVVGSLTEAGGLIGQVGAAAGVAAGAVAGAELARRAFSK